jgi:hypothetical protein
MMSSLIKPSIFAMLIFTSVSAIAGDPGSLNGIETAAMFPSHWAQLTADQQAALEPLKGRWEQLHQLQRERLIAAARHYPSMSTNQKLRFHQRLTSWSHLTFEQRDAARSAYRTYARLSPTQQEAVKRQWLKEHQMAQEVPTASAAGDLARGSR